MNMSEDCWITAKEACALLSITDTHLAMHCKKNRVEKKRLLNAATGELSRNVRYRKTDVLKLLA
ncbi:hypothetical protein OKW76_00315 [Sphingomonas sp. S1-29]|uniref:hypothetical protein n=1 Tax=Sphingomonas sp. S1-29 TaxID=2991074 RepID=UPI0022409CF9|nr:hypothetical protein [Sphingomonas sp. S1-29]UZK69568.1 hypothetical protein OKW76_00315 [Sphingomonas sp. S1-29]